MAIIGFTGTSKGMTARQLEALMQQLQAYDISEALDYASEELHKRGVARDSANGPSQNINLPPQPRYVGVGGWLLFLCVGLTILSPLFTLGELGNLTTLNRFSSQFPGLVGTMYIDAVLSICVMLYGMYAGVALWGIKKNAVTIAKTYFLIRLACAALVLILLFLAERPAQHNQFLVQAAITSLVQNVIGVAVWYTYLVKSKRVKATYPDAAIVNHFNAAHPTRNLITTPTIGSVTHAMPRFHSTINFAPTAGPI